MLKPKRKLNIKQYIFFIFIVLSRPLNCLSDVSLISRIRVADGLCRMAVSWIDMLKSDLTINFIPSGEIIEEDVPENIKQIIKNNKNAKLSNVSVLLEMLWAPGLKPIKYPLKSKINIAYSMMETTQIPNKWVNILNSYFDSVVVPDQWLVQVYQSCGVKIPIFVLPIPLMLDDFLSKEIKTKSSKPFIFGMSGVFVSWKNHKLLIDAFAKEFGNNPNVILKIHGRWSQNNIYKNVINQIKKLKLKNVEIIFGKLSQSQMVNFMESIDCYVLLSKAEGFSNTPREALALGIPCILSNNTAHQTICKTGLVRAVESNIMEPGFHFCFNKFIGKTFNCKQKKVQEALKDVYNNYFYYLEKAKLGRNWVIQYTPEQLKNYYINLIKPKKIILDKNNIITKEYLMTNSKLLYLKYKEIM